MSRLDLDLEFGTPGPRLSGPGLLALVASTALLVAVVLFAGQALSERAREARALQALNEQRQIPAAPESDEPRSDPKDAAQAQFARQTVRNLNTPWADLLLVLENAPSNVALLVVEPSAAKRSLTITAEAAGSTEMLDYIAALHADGRLTNIALVSHQLQVQAPGTPLRFQLRANWGDQP